MSLRAMAITGRVIVRELPGTATATATSVDGTFSSAVPEPRRSRAPFAPRLDSADRLATVVRLLPRLALRRGQPGGLR